MEPSRDPSDVHDTLSVKVELIGDEGLQIDAPVTVDWLTDALGKDSPFKAAQAGRLNVQLFRVEDIVHVRGRARVALGADCSRCLGPVDLALDAPVEVAMFPKGREPEPGLDGELQEDDMGVASYTNDEIDLAGILHDEVFLELPMNPLCSNECAGLCASCGQNLNEGMCNCERAEPGPWDALKKIKLN